MKTTIGDKIKQLRKSKNITQEQLANVLNISFQSISKWENNLGSPDILMIPKLANYFKISIDELFDYSLKEVEVKVDEICHEAYQYRETNPEKSVRILKNALEEYPDNDIILNNLLYVTIDVDERIQIANKLINETNDDSVKYDSLRFLAFAYKQKGDYENAVSAIEQVPELYFTKLGESAFIYEGSKKFESAEKQFWISFEYLLQMCVKLFECTEDKLYLQYVSDFIDILKLQPKIIRFDEYKTYITKLKEG